MVNSLFIPKSLSTYYSKPCLVLNETLPTTISVSSEVKADSGYSVIGLLTKRGSERALWSEIGPMILQN